MFSESIKEFEKLHGEFSQQDKASLIAAKETGDLGRLTKNASAVYMIECHRMLGIPIGMNAFVYIKSNGRTALYITKVGADHLAKVAGVSTKIISKETAEKDGGGFSVSVTTRATQASRNYEAIGTVNAKTSNEIDDAMMHAQSMSTRRAILGLLAPGLPFEGDARVAAPTEPAPPKVDMDEPSATGIFSCSDQELVKQILKDAAWLDTGRDVLEQRCNKYYGTKLEELQRHQLIDLSKKVGKAIAERIEAFQEFVKLTLKRLGYNVDTMKILVDTYYPVFERHFGRKFSTYMDFEAALSEHLLGVKKMKQIRGYFEAAAKEIEATPEV